MGESVVREQVVLFFETYHTDSQKLHESFQLAGRSFPVVVIEENGFLPEDVQSIYGYFLGDYRAAPGGLGRPRYFNEIQVPPFWEISSNNVMGRVQDLCRERARIFYASPKNRRQVQTVDWLDEKGAVRYSDHYNKYGAVYARTTFDAAGKRVLKSYFSPGGEEVIVENYVTQDIILNQGGAIHVFRGKTEFAEYFFRITGYDKYRIFFNTLSIPFFVSCRLPAGDKGDVLFWQEPVRDEIPGNMKLILSGQAARTGMIYVQKRQAYQRLMELGANPEVVKPKGFAYPFVRQNQGRPAALICTNSDQLEHCEQLVAALSEVEFHIAALTEMSSKLMALGRYENVRLYPTVKTDMVNELFRTCDLYLDINHGGEILSAVQRAFLNNQVILAFANTKHNDEVTGRENIFAPENAGGMIETIRHLTQEEQARKQALRQQKDWALAELPESFQQI